MRMWLVDPKMLCQRHLLGEHLEMHMFVGTIKKGKSVKGFIENRLVDTNLIQARHDELAKEMQSRGMAHKSDLDYVDVLNLQSVNVEENKNELRKRCVACRVRQEALSKELNNGT